MTAALLVQQSGTHRLYSLRNSAAEPNQIRWDLKTRLFAWLQRVLLTVHKRFSTLLRCVDRRYLLT